MRLRPRRDARLRGVQRERRRGGAGVLRGVGVAEHDLHAAVRLREPRLHGGQLEHLVEHVHAALEVLKLLEERDHVERGHILRMREGKARELVDVGHVLGALGERDDVAVRHLLAIALLDGPDGAERVEHLARHGRELAVDAVLADVGQGALVHERVLAELHLHHVEAEGLHLPDERLHGAVRGTGRPRLRERALYDAQVGQELVGAAVHGVGVAAHGRAQPVGHDEHHGAVRLERGDGARARREHLAHLNLVVPQVEQLIRGLGVLRLEREVAAHAAALPLERLHHVRGELRRDLARDLRRDVGVAVAVRADPAAGVEERRAHGRHGAGVLAEHPVVEAAVHLGHGVEERVVEDVDDRVGFLDGRRLLGRRGARAHEGIDLLQEVPLVLHERRAAQVRVVGEQPRDATDLALDRAAARLGGMRREHGVELERGEQLRRGAAAELAHELVVGHGELVRGVDGGVDRHGALALEERLHAVVLLREVREVEERRERAHHDLRVIEREPVDERDGVAERGSARLIAGRDALGVGLLARRRAAGVALVGMDHAVEQAVEQVADMRVVIAQHRALQAQEQRQAVAQALGQLDLGVALEYRVGVHRAELVPLMARVSFDHGTSSMGNGVSHLSITRPAGGSAPRRRPRRAARAPRRASSCRAGARRPGRARRRPRRR